MFYHSRSSVALLLLLVIACAQATARQPLAPERMHRYAGSIVYYVLEHAHYNKPKLNDELSTRAFDRYLEALDPNHLYFTAADVERFTVYRESIDDMLRTGRLEPAFDCFELYLRRMDERIQYALKLLGQAHDFSLDEQYLRVRDDEPWVADKTVLEGIWRKRIKGDLLNLRLGDKENEEIQETLKNRYKRFHTSRYQMKADDVFQVFVNALITSIDPHSSYLSPYHAENFDIHMRLSLEGIGAMLTTNKMDMTEINRLIPGGPARRSGKVYAQDRIVGVGQGDDGVTQDIIGQRLQDVVRLIRGPKGSVVRLEILPKESNLGGATHVVRLVREAIRLEENAVSSSILTLRPEGPRIGILDIPSFYIDFKARDNKVANYRSTTRDTRRELQRLREQEIDGLVIDLRNNGGGSLDEARDMTGLFIPSGPVVQIRNLQGRIHIKEDPDPTWVYRGPLIVLVNRSSASAAEIFAGAIQDYQRGLVIGETTFGKGTVQDIVNLNEYHNENDIDLGRLKVTIARFYRVSGAGNQFRGVRPDIFFPSLLPGSPESYGERALENALGWDAIAAADHLKTDPPTLLPSELLENHRQRLQALDEFRLYEEALKYTRRILQRKTISLNEVLRREENAHHETMLKQLEALPKYQVQSMLPEPLVTTEQDQDQDQDQDQEQDQETDAPQEIDFFLYEAARILEDLPVRAAP